MYSLHPNNEHGLLRSHHQVGSQSQPYNKQRLPSCVEAATIVTATVGRHVSGDQCCSFTILKPNAYDIDRHFVYKLEKPSKQISEQKMLAISDESRDAVPTAAHNRVMHEPPVEVQPFVNCASTEEKKLQQGRESSDQAKNQLAIDLFDDRLRCHGLLRKLLGPVDYVLHQRGTHCIGGYDLTRLIGTGGYCQVWEAQCAAATMDDAHIYAPMVAIKVMSKTVYAPKKRMDMLADEISVMKHVRHKNLVSATRVLHGPSNIFVVMELAAMTVSDYKRTYGDLIGYDCIRHILKGVLAGLACLHDHGIAHLDLKPDNILIKRDVPPEKLTTDDIRICDLGLCVVARKYSGGGVMSMQTRRGTPGLMAPEVYKASIGSEGYDATKADVWSLGVILMGLVGLLPATWMDLFSVKSWLHFELILDKTMNEVYNSLDSIDPELADLLVQMVNVCPRARLSVHQVINHSWVTARSAMQSRERNAFQRFWSKFTDGDNCKC